MSGSAAAATITPVSTAFRVRGPARWHYLDFTRNREKQVARFVERATAHLDRDSAPARRRVRSAVADVLAECETRSGVMSLHGVLLPVPDRNGEITVPASMTFATVGIPDGGLRPMEVLVAAAHAEPTAKPVETCDGVALRSHHFRDVRERLIERASEPAVSARQRARILGELPQQVFAFRVDYLVGRSDPATWVQMSLSAVVPADDARHELVRAYLELGDAVVGTFRWLETS